MKNLDEIILARRTVREFNSEIPSEDQVKQVLRAGLFAPYAALALSGKDKFRQFVVVEGQSATSAEIKKIVKNHTAKLVKFVPLYNLFAHYKISPAFQKRLSSDLLGEAPFFVFVIEPKGFPPAAAQSISHCLENMWLKATELGLGFRLISVFETMNKNQKLCEILSLEPGRYAINCCAIGYPLATPPNSVRPPLEEATRWLK